MRSSVVVLCLISFFGVKVAVSQSNEILIQGQTGKLYLEHTVVPKDNWYSVGRLYNVNPKTVALFNHLTLAKPLTIGQTIEIPLTPVNFSQTGQKLVSETLVPVFHIIQEKEWLYRISINHNKVPVPSLEKWNHINKDQAKAGMHLIVGFLKVKTALSALSKPVMEAPTVTAPIKPTADKLTTDKTATVNPSTVNPSTDKPMTGKPLNDPKSTSPDTVRVVTRNLPASPSVDRTLPPTNNTAAPAANTNPATNAASVTSGYPVPHFNGGVFKGDYSEGSKSASGLAGTFRSTSGWQDGKYYALMNNVMVGTIVKISVPGTDKTIFAKVLGQLPEMKESAGLTIRISTAAASELGTGDGRFNVDLKY